MPRPNQRSGSIPSPDTREEPRHGHGCDQCSPQIWNVVVKIVGNQALGDITDGPIIFHDPWFWHAEVIV